MKKIRERERPAFAHWFVLFLCQHSVNAVSSVHHVCLDLSQSSAEEKGIKKQEYDCKVSIIGRDNNQECVCGFFWRGIVPF